MKDRIRLLMQSEGLTHSKFAEVLGVQPSNISHLLSGRNNPGFDFIANVLVKFPALNPRWLILGENPVYINDKVKFAPENSSLQLQNTAFLDSPKGTIPKHPQIESVVSNDVPISNTCDNVSEIDFRHDTKKNEQHNDIEQIILLTKTGKFKRYLPE